MTQEHVCRRQLRRLEAGLVRVAVRLDRRLVRVASDRARESVAVLVRGVVADDGAPGGGLALGRAVASYARPQLAKRSSSPKSILVFPRTSVPRTNPTIARHR